MYQHGAGCALLDHSAVWSLDFFAFGKMTRTQRDRQCFTAIENDPRNDGSIAYFCTRYRSEGDLRIISSQMRTYFERGSRAGIGRRPEPLRTRWSATFVLVDLSRCLCAPQSIVRPGRSRRGTGNCVLIAEILRCFHLPSEPIRKPSRTGRLAGTRSEIVNGEFAPEPLMIQNGQIRSFVASPESTPRCAACSIHSIPPIQTLPGRGGNGCRSDGFLGLGTVAVLTFRRSAKSPHILAGAAGGRGIGPVSVNH
jgi:hypothetical protein